MTTPSFLDTPLAKLSGVGPRLLARLERLGLHNVHDLLWHFPARYEDYSEMADIVDLAPGMQTTVTAEVQRIETRRAWRKSLSITEAVLSDDTGSIRAVWFNQPYIENTLSPGTKGSFAGKVTAKEGELYFSNPTFERVTGRTMHTKHTARLVPVYPETKGLTSKWLRHLILPILEHLPVLDDPLPPSVLETGNYPLLADALHAVHFPETREDAERARERFVFEELLLLQLYNLREKQLLAREPAPELVMPLATLKKVLAALSFTLTPSQKQALWEIMQDMEATRPMNRLLQGDVGSGKTIVAVVASLIAHASGFQTAFMAPTEVLARQHFLTYQKLYPHLERILDLPTVGLVARGSGQLLYPEGLAGTASVRAVRERAMTGEVGILIGTHALLHPVRAAGTRGKKKSASSIAESTFKKLGLVVIDEQHRFGVRQRQALTRHGGTTGKTAGRGGAKKTMLPHFLSMSATPIPRTIMMTAFGDLTTSRITEMPKDRKPVVTKIVGPNDRDKAYAFLRKEVREGRQAFVICARVDPPKTAEELPPSERWKLEQKLDAKSVKEEHERLARTVFRDLSIDVLYGAMPSAEKEEIMASFREGALDILVATSVIEVGIDVPNATVMLIENAEQFGLAQLYQFRGRVGRGAHQSHCFLFTESTTRTAAARLAAILKAKNGFELAEHDLKLRGPGEFLGRSQSGLPDLAMQHLSNEPLVKKSREAARRLLDEDSDLQKHSILHERLIDFAKKLHKE